MTSRHGAAEPPTARDHQPTAPDDPPAVPWHEARRSALAAGAAEPRRSESVALADGAGRLLATSVRTATDLPHYASSAMDGWAVAGDPPWRVIELPSPPRLRAGEAIAIVTGGVVPLGCRGILPDEHAALRSPSASAPVGTHLAAILTPNESARPGAPAAGQHIRPTATEARAGEVVIQAGTLLNPVHLALAAACGADDVVVVQRPRVLLVLTGAEVVQRGVAGPGLVRDSFGPSLPPVLAALGAQVVASGRIGDSLPATLAALQTTPEVAPHLIITTGGTGDSPADHVRPALRALGAEFLVSGVAVRPGAPALLARLPGGPFVIGLPGNPLAALISVLTLVHPLLAGLRGQPLPPLGEIQLAEPIAPSRAPLMLRPFHLAADRAVPTEWHGAGMLRGFADADGLLLCPGEGAHPGDRLPTLPIPW